MSLQPSGCWNNCVERRGMLAAAHRACLAGMQTRPCHLHSPRRKGRLLAPQGVRLPQAPRCSALLAGLAGMR